MALDSVYLDIRDLDGLRAETDDAVAVGFDAKVAIHPTQVAVIRAGYAPTEEQAQWARNVLEAARAERGVFQFDGQMVDMPVLRRAAADRRARTQTPSRYLRLAAANLAANSGDSIDAACGPISTSTAMRCWSVSTVPGLTVARIEAFVAMTTSRGADGRTRGERARGGDRVVGDLERQAVPHRRLCVEPHPEQQGCPGDLRPDRPLQHPRGTAAGMDAELLESRVE